MKKLKEYLKINGKQFTTDAECEDYVINHLAEKEKAKELVIQKIKEMRETLAGKIRTCNKDK